MVLVFRLAGALVVAAVAVVGAVVVVTAVVVAIVPVVVTIARPPVAPAVIVALIVVIATTAIPHTLVVANRARAQDSEGSVGVPAGLLDNDVATGVVGAALVDRVVVGAPSNLAPDTVH